MALNVILIIRNFQELSPHLKDFIVVLWRNCMPLVISNELQSLFTSKLFWLNLA